MKHKLTFFRSILLLFFFLISSSMFAQIVTNGGFGTDPAIGPTWSAIGTYSATWDGVSFNMDLTAGDLVDVNGYFYQDLNSATALTASTLYECSIDLVAITGVNGVQVGIYDASDNMVYSHEFTTVATHTFSFTPTSSVVYQIRLAGGISTAVTIDNVIVTANAAPTATPLVSGTKEAGYVLTVAPVLADAEGDTPLSASYQWYRANTSTGTVGKVAISGATSATYRLTSADIAKYIMAEVTPIAGSGTSPGVATESDLGVYQGPVVSNVAPAVTGGPTINILTALKQGEKIDVSYVVTDGDGGDTPGGTYQLYRSTDAAGVNKIALTGAGSSGTGATMSSGLGIGSVDYTLVFADVGKYIILEVTPTSNQGITPGTVSATNVGTVIGFVLGIPTTTAPTDEATLVTLTPTFTGTANAGSFDTEDQYELEIATDGLFSNVVFSKTNVAYSAGSPSLTLVASLDPATKHYWRLRAKLTTTTPVTYSPWSQVKTFTTTPIDAAPIPTHPLGGNLVYTNAPTFYWYSSVVSTDQKFEVYYGTGTVAPLASPSTGGAYVFIPYTTIGTTLFYEVTSALASNTSYHWWVRSTDGTNYSAWSSMQDFATAASNGGPVVPVGTYPTGGAMQYSNSPTLYWYVTTVTTGLKYEVYLSTTTTPPGVPTYNYTTVGTNTYFQLSGLVSNTEYNWWVRSTDAAGANPSALSDRYSFQTTTSSGSPVVPTLTHPVGGTTVYFADVGLYWYVTTVATDLEYDLYYSTSNTDPTSGTNPSVSGITTTNTTISGLNAGDTYYWWVRSTHGTHLSGWSSAGSFVVSSLVGVINTPVAIYPTGGIQVTGTSVDLSWGYYGSGTGITYEARYSLYPGMSPLVGGANITLSDASATTQTLTGLPTGTTFYWQVRAKDNNNVYSSWSTATSFSTASTSAAPIVVPMVGSPIANVVVDSDSPELSWFLPTQSENLTYELQYSENKNFSDAIEIKDINSTSVALTNINSGKSYSWRVRSKANDGSVSIYSAIGSFIGQGVTAVEEENIIPNKFEVSQNYPNPFNPSTIIKYSLPEAQFVTLRIYNMLGQEVATLINNEVEAGIHDVTWNGVDNSGTKVATGTYIYRVVAGNNILTKKMILLK